MFMMLANGCFGCGQDSSQPSFEEQRIGKSLHSRLTDAVIGEQCLFHAPF